MYFLESRRFFPTAVWLCGCATCVQEDFFICGIKSINRINSNITVFTVKTAQM